MDRTVDAANLAAPGADLSLISLFLHADIIVQLVMLLLLSASIFVWGVTLEKLMVIRRINRMADAFEDRFWSGGSLEMLYDVEGSRPAHPMAAVFGAGLGEWRRSARVNNADMARGSVRDRIDRAMNVAITRELQNIEKHMIVLASVGSVAPFIGLFGTVWGIMHSFSSIAAMHNTNLSVVAPGIAEALFATAIGLVAAIPSVLAYNQVSTMISRFAARLENFAAEFASILSRQGEEIA